MTMAEIQSEMAFIREIKRTDVESARERWRALKGRIERYCDHHKLPSMWREMLLKELTVI